MEKKILLSIIFAIAFICSNAQLTISPELKTALQNKTAFNDIMNTVTDYYIQKNYRANPKLFSEYKKWNRWGWYMGSHLDSNGNPVNISERTWAASEQNLAQRVVDSNTQNRTSSNTGVWAPIGPYTITQGVGRTDRLAFHPTNANIIYAGTPAGGLWRTLDGGANWHALNGYLPNIGVSGIVIDRDNPNTIYVLTGDGDSNIPPNGLVFTFGYIRPSIGILKSTDGGGTWSKLSNIVLPGTTFYGFKLVQSEDFHNRFFACTSDGLYRSTDFGQTWSRDVTIGITPVYDLELGPPSYVYACTDRQVFISTNYGNPFFPVSNTEFSSVPTTNDRASLAVTPNQPNWLYVSFGRNQLLYRSQNNGTNFTLVNPSSPTTQAYMAAMAVSPSNASNVIIGEVNLQRSMSGGSTGSFLVVGAGTVHADVHDLQYNPINHFLYAATDGGVYRSLDQGATWTSLFNGMQLSQFYHFTGITGNNNFILGGAQDNGNIQSSDNAGSYGLVLGGDGFESVYLNGNNNVYYYTTNQFVNRGTRIPLTNINRTPPGGVDFYPTVAIHPTNNQIVYAGYSNGVYRSNNGGDNWTNKGNQGSAGGRPAGGMAVSPNVPDRIYAASNVAIWRSDNTGDNWTTISTGTGWPAVSAATPITDITSRANNGDEIWISLGGYTGGNKVYYSSNGGASWVNYSASLPNVPVHCIKYSNEGDVYIGTDIGVFFMDYTMNDWVPFSNGLPVVPVADLFINETDGSIRAGTFGRGIWQSDLYSDCGPFMFLSGLTQGTNFYQSGGFIETSQQIPGSLGNSVKLRSPTKIIFKAGFSARNNSYVHAIIGACGQGVFSRTAGNETAVSKDEYLKMNLQGNRSMLDNNSGQVHFD